MLSEPILYMVLVKKQTRFMTNSLVYFDTDCISSFLVVDQEDILLQLYPYLIVLPQQVFTELTHPSVRFIGNKIKRFKLDGLLVVKEILTDTEEFYIYRELAYPSNKEKRIGKGEAAAIALAKSYDGVLASNNMRDIRIIVDDYGLRHITSADILADALALDLIDESGGNKIWGEMILRRIKLPTRSFTEYLRSL